VNALKSFFGHHEMSIAEKVKLPKISRSLPTFLNHGEIEKLLESIMDKRDLSTVRMLYASGLRVSELIRERLKIQVFFSLKPEFTFIRDEIL
jgi:site-specific recombinase XerD